MKSPPEDTDAGVGGPGDGKDRHEDLGIGNINPKTLVPQGQICRFRADYARHCADLALNDPANAKKYEAWIRGVAQMTATSTATGGNTMIAQLEDARVRLDRGTDLIVWALDIREQLGWGFDIDDARDLVADFVRACDAHRRR